MTGQTDKDNVLHDYAAFLKALLPQAVGFVCHDRNGRVCWSDIPAGVKFPVTDGFRGLVTTALLGQAIVPEAGRLTVAGNAAYVLPLEGESRCPVGVLTVLTDEKLALPYQFVADVLAPALRNLQRELFLRMLLLDGHRKLTVQAAEERLLHEAEEILHQRQPCEQSLQSILDLCLKHLGVAGASLFIPDKSILLVSGTATNASEAGTRCARLLTQARSPEFDPNEVSGDRDVAWTPVHKRNNVAQGVLALSGCGQSEFSQERMARVVRYLGTHIDSLMDRDFDNLTGLMAWPVFERELMAAVAAAGKNDGKAGGKADDKEGNKTDGREDCTVVCLNIDQLHVVNDTFGREAGDEVLTRFAGLMREFFAGYVIGRVSGDNFVALLRGVSIEEARKICEGICDRFRENAYVRGDQTFRPTVSIGIGPLGCNGSSGATGAGGGPLSVAQVACKAAKERGRGRVEVYESGDQSIVKRAGAIQLVGQVRNAIENNRLALMGQRLMPLAQGRVPNYYEVLVRIINDDGEYMPPADFISAAERYQLMEEMDRWVVSRTLDLLAAQGGNLQPGEARFAINLSGQSLGSNAFLPFVESEFTRTRVPPALITFEITESVAVARMQQAQAFMHALRKIGCRFSLDDFGTGLSSFAYLKLFPVDTLKIDGSFIRDISTNVVSQSVVAAIAEVARVMQFETVAEYVEEQAALDLLRKLNISYAQGYLVGQATALDVAVATIGSVIDLPPEFALSTG